MSAPDLLQLTSSPSPKISGRFAVNGEIREIMFASHKTLLEVLREDLALTGTKHGCELGECGTCTVLVDGYPMLSCLMLASAYLDQEITTVEGLAHGFIEALRTLIVHCQSPEAGGYTPSDFPKMRLSQQELDELMTVLGKSAEGD